jgi:hypothetical protein
MGGEGRRDIGVGIWGVHVEGVVTKLLAIRMGRQRKHIKENREDGKHPERHYPRNRARRCRRPVQPYQTLCLRAYLSRIPAVTSLR